MDILTCSVCAFSEEMSEWICVFENGKLLEVHCPRCTSMTAKVNYTEPTDSSKVSLVEDKTNE